MNNLILIQPQVRAMLEAPCFYALGHSLPCRFPGELIIYNPEQGLSLTKTAQVRMVGNSVCPPLSQALVEANFKHEALFMERTA